MPLSAPPRALLVLQNDPVEGPGLIKRWAKDHGISVDLKLAKDCFTSGVLPSLSQDTPIILLGGAASVVAPASDCWLQTEIDWVKEAITQNIPVMGICLGAQILAKALGAAVQPLQSPEIGWCELHLHSPHYLAAPNNAMTVLQWHDDGFALPMGCLPFGSSPVCAQQGFLDQSRRLLGVQFHPEWDVMLLKDLIEVSVNVPPALRLALTEHALFNQQTSLLEWLMTLWLDPSRDV